VGCDLYRRELRLRRHLEHLGNDLFGFQLQPGYLGQPRFAGCRRGIELWRYRL